MSLYIDTSCLVKLLVTEPESAGTDMIVTAEDKVIISSLTRLETLIQVQAWFQARLLTKNGAARLLDLLNTLLQKSPYELRPCLPSLMKDAEEQIQPITSSTYCRTLDRLHLATMTAFGLKRLLTNDDTQARAARAIGLRVIMPR